MYALMVLLEILIDATYLDRKSTLSIKILMHFPFFPNHSILMIHPTEILAHR